MQPDAFITRASIDSINRGNKIISTRLPNTDFFTTYSEAFEHFKSKALSYTHIVTSITPETGLQYFDKYEIPKEVQEYLYMNHRTDMGSWLNQYKYSLGHLSKFKSLNASIKFIVYSGAGYNEKPIDSPFGDCLNHILGNYEYVPKTEDPVLDSEKIIKYLREIKFIITGDIVDGKLRFDRYFQQGIILADSDLKQAVNVFIKSANDSLANVLSRFEELIEDNYPEIELELFLRQHPELVLEPNYHKSFISQPFLSDSTFHNKRPDLLLKPLLPTIPAKLIELKRPDAKTIKNVKKDLNLSSNVYQAINQVRRYQQYFDDEKNAKNFELKYGIKVFKPSAKVIIGRNYGHYTPEEILFQKEQFAKEKIELFTYKELYDIKKINAEFYS